MRKLLIALVALAAVLAGCSDSSAAASSSYCGYVIGNGSMDSGSAQDRNIRQIIRPGDTVRYDNSKEEAKYFPCGPRNYRIGEGGDAQNPLNARTDKNIPVFVYVSVYWTPNRSDEGLPLFIQFCEKYQCATSSPGGGDGSNFSSPGWNGMLAENMYPTLQRVAERAFTQVSDAAWESNSAEEKDKAAAAMELGFAAELQKTTGYTTDIICGSGSGGPPSKFDCQNVRIVVDAVVAQGDMQNQKRLADEAQRSRDLKVAQSAEDIRVTNDLYGPQLGAQFRFCRDLGDKCRVIIGANGVPQVVTP